MSTQALNPPDGDSRTLTAALSYAEQGVHVLPVRVTIAEDGTKTVSPVSRWRENSSSSPTVIRAWFEAGSPWQDASLAIDCEKSRLVVIDLDVSAEVSGLESWAALRGNTPGTATWRAATPGGGEHWFYREHPTHMISNSVRKLGAGIDVRGAGGFVIAPPSTDERGAYRWLEGEAEWLSLPVVPTCVLDKIRETSTAAERLAYVGRTVQTGTGQHNIVSAHHEGDNFRAEWTPEDAHTYITVCVGKVRSALAGTRNDELNKAAFSIGHFVPVFLTAQDAANKLAIVALECGLELSEITKTIESGLHAGMRTPHTVATPVARPRLDVSNTSIATEWLRHTAGTGHLASLFKMRGGIIRVPRITFDGYRQDTDATDTDPLTVRMTVSNLRSLIQYVYTCVRAEKKSEQTIKEGSGGSDSVGTGTGADGDTSEKGYKLAQFPLVAANAAIDTPGMLPNIRTLRGVTHSPLLRADGSILDTAGYDPATQLIFSPAHNLSMPACPKDPTALEISEANALLDRMLSGFSFVTDADKSNYLGLLLTPLLREYTPGPYKLGAIGAPMQGSGKTLLANIIRVVHGGVFRAELPVGEEFRKAVTSILEMDTGPVVHFDNVTGVLRNPALAGLLTSDTWSDRRLGSNDMSTSRNDRLWLVTGNNLSLGGDIPRRAVWVTIDPQCPDPHTRTDFAISDLEGWVRANRGQVLHACLVLIRAWIVSGAPSTPRGSDSYGKWIEVVSGVLSHAGRPGGFDAPVVTRQRISTDDEEWAELLEAIYAVYGTTEWTVADLLTQVQVHDYGVEHKPIPLAAFPDELEKRIRREGVGAVGKSLGRFLTNRDGRWVGDITVRSPGKLRTNQRLWAITRA